MDKEYLPIGSVCILYKNDIKVMVTGYLLPRYDEGFRIFKYSGLPYPDGVLKNREILFDDQDIKEVNFEGFKDDEYNKLNEKLTSIKIDELNEKFENVNDNNAIKYKFDENGTVIGVEGEEDSEYENPFNSYKEESEVKTQKTNEDTSEWPIFNKNYKFDENGTVIGVEGEEETPETEEGTTEYKFDENGIVIGVEGEEETPETEEGTTEYKFDENGIVIGVEGEEETPETEEGTTEYKFDENGTVIGVEGEEETQE
jgi:hypothetical protein